MNTTAREPCKSCPYRRDAKLEHWHPSEFENLLAQDANPISGSPFACHQDRKIAPHDRGVCVGWLLDQRERGAPSIKLRLGLMRDAGLRAQFEEARAPEGVELYESIEEMCLANGVTP